MTVEDGDSDAVTAFRAEKGSPEAVAGCHTALVGGYVIEGDVPRADIDRLLSDRPDAVGLAVPGTRSEGSAHNRLSPAKTQPRR